MKVSFLNFNPTSTSGPNSFGKRLANEFIKNGHEILLEPSEKNLIFIETDLELPKNSKNVLRLDGIWTKKEQIETHNRKIKNLYDKCDSVVWQSEYDKILTTKLWGLPKSGKVIHNGINLQEARLSSEFIEFRKQVDEIFVCSANWHNQKRLQENIEFFQANKGKNSKLLILGNITNSIDCDESDVLRIGSMSHETCLQIYKMSDWMIHLAWRDHCPNVVIEALSQGCPVICSSSGGTKEIVGENGIELLDQNDNNIDQVIFDYDSPPPMKIEKINLKKIEFDSSSLPTIQKSYDAYLHLFKNI